MVGYSFGGAIVLRYAHQHLDRMAGLVLVESPTEAILNSYANETPLTLPDTGRLPPLGNLPLAVITVDTQEYMLPKPPNISSEEAMKAWQNTQSELVMLSEQGKQIFVKDTNHYNILGSHAEDVVDAIMAIVEQHRKKWLLVPSRPTKRALHDLQVLSTPAPVSCFANANRWVLKPIVSVIDHVL